ncbi:hypothetical protein BAE44_0026128 [Dichanthelium oligosanthes]|uniref:Uncharacterized protein n=1 Tax=Dichanthelium oligosanthes TaxID=888268 RepID=A0A1E5UJ02_9POAL|nr:hypothetical protein BAE44_0026128 [Dichanthelium oligosanthes]
MGGGECKSNDYGAAAYWDARYSSSSSGSPAPCSGGGEFFDWYQTYPALRSLLRTRVPAASRVLMLGCGNSRRLLRPHGIYLSITYGAPKERVPLLNQAGCSWSIALYIMPTPGYQQKMSKGAPEPTIEEVALTEDGQLPLDYVIKDPESHFIYVCHKLAVKEANCRDTDLEETAKAN